MPLAVWRQPDFMSHRDVRKAILVTRRQPALAFRNHLSQEIVVHQSHTPDLIDLLRQTLKQLEETQDLLPDDPTLVELKRSLVSAIAELRVARSRAA